MAFLVEDGSGVAGANSYASASFADEYHGDRGNAAWKGSPSEKEAALIKATAYVESKYTWITGWKADIDQGLSWPRYEAEDEEGYGFDYNEIPNRIKEAVCELALKSLTEDLFAPLDRETSSVSVGSVSVSYVPGGAEEKRYLFVDRLLRGLARNTSSSGVRFADVERA